MLHVAVVQSFSDENVICYVLPVMSMTSLRVHTVGQIQIQAWHLQRSELFAATRQVAPLNYVPGSEVSCRRLPCLLLLRLFADPGRLAG